MKINVNFSQFYIYKPKYRVSLQKSVISKYLTFSIFDPVLLIYKKNDSCFHKIEFLVVILSVQDF